MGRGMGSSREDIAMKKEIKIRASVKVLRHFLAIVGALRHGKFPISKVSR